MADKRIQIKDKSGNKLFPAIDLSLSNNIGTLDGSRLTDATVSSSKLSGPITIDKGGTGASTVSEARTNLEVYSTTEVDSLIAGIDQFQYLVVSELPEASADTMFIIYLTASGDPESGSYVEWLTIDKGASANPRYVWEKIGTTAADLDEYSKKTHHHNFTGSQATLSVSGTYSKTTNVTISTGIGVVNYTPVGSVSTTRSTDVVLDTITVNSITDVGSLPTLSSETTSAPGDIEYITDASLSHNFGIDYKDPTFSTTDIYSITDIGSAASLTFDTTSTSGEDYIKSLSKDGYTPSGSVTATFTGSEQTKTVSITPSGSVVLGSNTISTDGVKYVEAISSTGATGTLTDGFVTAIDGGSGNLTTDTTSTNGIKYVESVGISDITLTPTSANGVSVTGSVSGSTLVINAVASSNYLTGVALSGGKLNPTTRYLHHSHTGARVSTTASAITFVSGGTTTPTTKYFHPSFIGSSSLGDITFTPGGSINASFTGNESTSVVTGGTTAYMHWTAGSTPSRSASPIKAFTSVSTVGSATLTGSSTLTVDKAYLKFSQGTLPTKGDDTTVATGVKTQPTFSSTFSGTGVNLTASVTNTETTISSTGTYTPEGTIGESID